MIVVERSLTEVGEGMILGKDIIGANGMPLLFDGYILDEKMICKLKTLGHHKIFVRMEKVLSDTNTPALKDIHSKDFHMVYLQGVQNMKSIFQAVSAEKKLHWSIIDKEVALVWEMISFDSNMMKNMEFDGSIEDYTYRHCLNVAILSGMLAKWMKLDQNEIYMIIGAGLLHDIGKLLIPDKILNKPGALTILEYRKIKSHPAEGVRILEKNIIGMEDKIKSAILLHHERINGKGYPYGISSDKIPVSAKIIGIADTFDAMISRRAYKNPMNLFDVIEVMLGRISEYDYLIMNVFFQYLTSLLVGEKVILSNGMLGEICFINHSARYRPIIVCKEEFFDLSKCNLKIIMLESIRNLMRSDA